MSASGQTVARNSGASHATPTVRLASILELRGPAVPVAVALAAAIAVAHETVPGATLARISFPRSGASAFEVVMAPPAPLPTVFTDRTPEPVPELEKNPLFVVATTATTATLTPTFSLIPSLSNR